jgi:hypothetical protein
MIICQKSYVSTIPRFNATRKQIQEERDKCIKNKDRKWKRTRNEEEKTILLSPKL